MSKHSSFKAKSFRLVEKNNSGQIKSQCRKRKNKQENQAKLAKEALKKGMSIGQLKKEKHLDATKITRGYNISASTSEISKYNRGRNNRHS